ncbi:MAG TPA: N-acetylmuramoyl-L-alanine amidase, partial [Hyphomicrobium sp.]|nr:N-acetylmuramoyl-L-alanine amidase [Hyphomicrobium sp.]
MSGLTSTARRRPLRRPERASIAALTALGVSLVMSATAEAAPAIRTSAANTVPACASPERLMAFLASRNPNVDPRYREIARWYKYWGEAWRVRWDYAFFQMVIETNALKFRRADGQRGDVHEKQNNFAGIGATGGG